MPENPGNRLKHATSPYLLQHAHNPVNWWEWSEEAFAFARQHDRLVLVSIGYSSCHWCHVMERESFEDTEVAELMNSHFVCIKVDREERPDIDQLYMDAVQLVSNTGGWPLNCFVLPDKRPLYGGTYFPKSNWMQVLRSLSELYAQKPEEAMQYAANLSAGMKQMNGPVSYHHDVQFRINETDTVMQDWLAMMDTIWGGMNRAPKFPMPVNLQLLLDYGVYTKQSGFTDAVHLTLRKMADGGIYDQIGGGFSRYSTDITWKVPHFEKMLYDNAQLLSVYATAYRQYQEPRYLEVIRDTIAFLKREMMSEEGLFYAALDADSEGGEGIYYCWTKHELRELLGTDENVFSLIYRVSEKGNWEHGLNILHRTQTTEQLEADSGMHFEDLIKLIGRCRLKLLEQRNKRTPPGLDDKVIVSWNALLISGLCEAFKSTGELAYLETAQQCADGIFKKMWADDRLYRIYCKGKVSVTAFSEDYASLCEACIHLFEADGNEAWLFRSADLLNHAIELFFEEGRNLFAFVDPKTSQLPMQRFDTLDDVTPSSNSVFAHCLLKLGYLMDEPYYHELRDAMMKSQSERITGIPTAHANWWRLILNMHAGWYQVVSKQKISFQNLNNYYPGLVYLSIHAGTHIPLLKEKMHVNEEMYFVCCDKSCGLPVASSADAFAQVQYRLKDVSI